MDIMVQAQAVGHRQMFRYSGNREIQRGGGELLLAARHGLVTLRRRAVWRI